MDCPSCGKETSVAGGRCTSCGTPLAGATLSGATMDGATLAAIGAGGQTSGFGGETFLPEAATLPPSGEATTLPPVKGAAGRSVAADAATMAPGAVAPTMSVTQATLSPDTTGLPRGGVRRPQGGPLSTGQAFGPRYHVIRLLGLGGMGAVYQSWDEELGVAVALKVIRLDRRRGRATADAEKRFKTELLLARQVTHKNVVRIHDLGEIDGIKYITMPYIQGDDLATVLQREGKVPMARALHIARQIAGGMGAAHEAGVVHRDLKPANIMIAADDLALIMDFGISASNEEATAGGIVGTLEYMAPEQSTGGAVDSRADMYAFGLILYEMLTGLRKGTATTAQERIEAMKQRAKEGLPPVRSLDETIPIPLDALVTRCLELDPAARFATTAELMSALAALDAAGELIPIPARVSKKMMAAAGVLVAALLAGTFVVTRRASQAPKQHEPVSVAIADFQNTTNDPTFDHTLEPMLRMALEGAGFISAYDRTGISALGVPRPDTLDERAAMALAVKQGVGVVLSGSLDRQGTGYVVSVKATQAVTGNVISTAKGRASSKEQVLGAATKLARTVRDALGDNTSDSRQLFALDTLSATSIDVVRNYAAAMDALASSRFEEARRGFSAAIAQDPNFGLGYAGLAVASRNLDKMQDAQKYIQEAVRHLDGMTERERYRTRGLAFEWSNDYQACVKEFGDLIARYSADAMARNNLAVCLTYLRQLPKAMDEMRQVIKILPKRTLYRENLALYAAYNSDFQAAEQEARAIEKPGVFGLLPLAFAQVLQGQLPQAGETFQSMSALGQQGVSYAATGQGELAIYQGRFSEAARIFAAGSAADLASKDNDRAASKFTALAYAQVLRQQKPAAVAAAEKALAASEAVKIRFLTARVFVEAGAVARARTLASSLGADLQAEPQAYAKIIEGEIALKNRELPQAVKLFTDANAVFDTWMGHFDLGRAYLEARSFIQADSEFDRCIARRGETMALFLDEEPTFGYLPSVYYYKGRVREDLKSAGFAESYRTYLTIRGESKEDPLLPEVRRRAGQ